MPAARGVRDAIAVALALLGVIVAAFPDVLLGGRTLSAASYAAGVLPSGPLGAPPAPLPPPLYDVEGAAWVDEPAPHLIHRQLARGQIPSWNAAEGLGAPLLGNPNSGALAPLQLPVNLWPTPLVQDLTWIGRVYLLALLTALLARELGASPAGCVVAGTALALSGHTLGWIAHHPLNTDAFVPLALVAALRCRSVLGWPTLVLGATAAAALLGVKPQSALVAAGFGLLWLVAGCIEQRGSGGPAGDMPLLRRRLAAWIVGVALGAGVAAVALLPFAESYRQAAGLVRAGRSGQSEWAVAPGSLASLVGPWASKITQAMAERVGALDAPAAEPGLPYVGALALAGAALGLWRLRRRPLGWALGATVALYLVKTTGQLPFSLAGVPLLGSVQYVKYSFPMYLAVALLAGLGIGGGRTRGTPAGAEAAAAPAGLAGSVPRLRAPRRLASGWIGLLLAAALVGELLWLARRDRPRRLDPYRPAAYVEALRSLLDERPGRISGPVDLAPPLVSAVLGLRDLRAIDVLTPGATYDFVGRLIAPSQGVTWVLADPDPLLVASAPAAALADVRWVLARGALREESLPAAVRALVSSRRLGRLLGTLEALRIDSARLSGGIHELGGDRRFHWTCSTPCRFRFAVHALPERFAVGIGAAGDADLELRLTAEEEAGGRETVAARGVLRAAQPRWLDLWVGRPAAAAAGGRGSAAPAGTVTLEIDGAPGKLAWVGGVGPSEGEAAERDETERELGARRAQLASLRLRYADPTAHVYEIPGAVGGAYLATDLVRVSDASRIDGCVLEAAGRRVACVAEADLAGVAWPTASSGEARVVRDGDAALEVQASSAQGGVLVVPRLAYPGWRAALDGEDVTRFPVNGAMIGVVVPPGEHRVELRYRPTTLLAGATVSAVSLAACVVLAWLARSAGVRGGTSTWQAGGRRI